MSIHLETTKNLFRYISEWSPIAHAHTKGGYLIGEITAPISKQTVRMTIETFPDSVPGLEEPVHPLILHTVRMGKGRRQQELEPVPTHVNWRQEFIIKDRKLYIVNRTSEADEGRNIPEMDLICKMGSGNTIKLSGKKEELNLVLLQPKQGSRAKDGEATVDKVLADRLPKANAMRVTEITKMFTGKNARNMKRVKIMVRFFHRINKTDDDDDVWEEFSTALSTGNIIDVSNREIGALELYDATPLKSCSRGGRKIVILSEYDLSNNTAPRFIVVDSKGKRRPSEEEKVIQPQEVSVRKTSMIFISPPQTNDLVQCLEANGLRLKLTAHRGGENGDGHLATTDFGFEYIHHPKRSECLFCDLSPDNPSTGKVGIKDSKRRMHKDGRSEDRPSKMPRHNSQSSDILGSDSDDNLTITLDNENVSLTPQYSPSPANSPEDLTTTTTCREDLPAYRQSLSAVWESFSPIDSHGSSSVHSYGSPTSLHGGSDLVPVTVVHAVEDINYELILQEKQDMLVYDGSHGLEPVNCNPPDVVMTALGATDTSKDLYDFLNDCFQDDPTLFPCGPIVADGPVASDVQSSRLQEDNVKSPPPLTKAKPSFSLFPFFSWVFILTFFILHGVQSLLLLGAEDTVDSHLPALLVTGSSLLLSTCATGMRLVVWDSHRTLSTTHTNTVSSK